jgi:hypothetical protein
MPIPTEDEFLPPAQPVLVRTLSDAHWHTAGHHMFATQTIEVIAGRQDDWLFKVTRVAGDNDRVYRQTYLRGVLVDQSLARL